MTPVIQVVTPHVLGSSQIRQFANAVGDGGEVDRDSLQARVRNAAWLAIATIDGKPVGCGALKLPTDNHREYLTEYNGTDCSYNALRYELGWIVVAPEARGHKLSRMIVAALMVKANGASVFCTVRADNQAIQKACADYGFTEVGKRWQGARGLLGLAVWQPRT